MGGFVDVHSHTIPSGDDGARSIEEAVELCGLALAGGTRVLFATPHVHADWDHYPLTLERERLFAQMFPVVSRAVSTSGLELLRGWEVFPTVLRDRDPHEFLLEGTCAVLVEFPGSWLSLEDDSSLVLEAAERLLTVELVPVIAHPERSLGGSGLTSGSRTRSSSVAAYCARTATRHSVTTGQSPNRSSRGWSTRAWSRSSLPMVTGGSGRHESIRHTVCLSHATERRRSRRCSTGPPYPGSGSPAGTTP